jgi:hypothetical protein
MHKTKQTHYFASDGNYGGAAKVIILETEHWTEDDWITIEEAGDLGRVQVALDISASYNG